MPDSASPLEIIWTAQALTGIVLGLLLVRFWERKRRRLIRARLNSWRMTATLTHLVRKAFYLSCHTAFALAGLLAMLDHPFGGPVALAAFLFVSLGMQADMVQSYRHYRQLEEIPHDA